MSHNHLVLLAVLISVILSCYLVWNTDRVPASPDEASVLFFSEHLVKEGSLLWHSDLNDEYGVDFFLVRGMVDVGNNDYAPQYSATYILALSLGQIDDRVVNLQAVISIFSALGVLAVYLLVREVFSSKIALMCCLLMSILSPYVAFSNIFTDMVPTVTAYLISLYLFFKFINTRKHVLICLAGFFFVFAVFLREANAPIYLAGYVALLISFRENFRDLKTLAAGFISILLSLGPFLLLNQVIYGNPLSTGRIGTVNQLQGSKAPFQFDIGDTYESVYHHIIDLLPLLLLGILGMLVAYRLKSHSVHQKKMRFGFLIGTLVIAMVTIAEYAPHPNLYGFGTEKLICSPVRYYLPVYIILVVYFSIFIQYLITRSGVARLIAGALLLTSVAFFSVLSFDVERDGSLARKGASIQVEAGTLKVFEGLPSDAVIFTLQRDKVAFPTRPVGIVYVRRVVKEGVLHDSIDIELEVIPVVRKLLDDGRHVYVTSEVNDLITALRQSDAYQLDRVSGAGFLFEINSVEGRVWRGPESY